MSTIKKKSKRKWLILIPVYLVVFLALAITAILLSIELRYRAEEKKIENEPAEVSEEYYYYNQLTYKEQLLFNEICKSAENLKSETEILPYRYTNEEFKRIIQAVNFDVVKLFYIDMDSFELYCDNYKTSVTIDYFTTASQITQMKMEFEAVSAAAMAYIQGAESDFKKAVILHDFLIQNCKLFVSEEYVKNKEQIAHTAYGALVDKKAFCNGYAAAYKILLNRCGVECILVEGNTEDISHVWNIVNQDGKYYHIDCTWNDSDLDFAQDISFHGFFNLSDEAISRTHTKGGIFTLPECNSETDYYSQISAVVNSAEEFENIAYSQIKNAVEKKNKYFEISPMYTKNEEEYKEMILKAIDRVNGEYPGAVLSRSYRAFNSSENGNGLTVQIYYINE